MIEQHADGDIAVTRILHFEIWNVGHYRLVQRHHSTIHKFHHSHSRKGL